jgi:acetyltransferase
MPMFAPGFELLVGLTWDATFGALVAVGRGGIWTEVEDDFAVVPALSTESELVGALSSLRCFPMISGTRGQPRLDLEALVDLIGSVGKLADEGEPLSLDLNPVILYVHGLAIADFRVLAVDPW